MAATFATEPVAGPIASEPTPGRRALDAAIELPRALYDLAAGSFTPIVSTLALLLSLWNTLGGSIDWPDLPLPGPDSSVARQADRLATQHGFTPADRTAAADVFRRVADEIGTGGHESATTVNHATLQGLTEAFGGRWSSVGLPWFRGLSPSWKKRFQPASPPAELAPVWREVAQGLGG